MLLRTAYALSLLTLFGLLDVAVADDWPQWLGPQRDAVWRETGIVRSFPNNELPVRWRVPVGLGYAGPAVADGKVFVMDYAKRSGDLANNPGGTTALEGQERVLCFSAATGQRLWEHAYDRPYKISYASGPRCTPTVADGKVYALGAEGNLTCLDAETGNVIWTRDLMSDYNTQTPIWGHSAHPLVEGDKLFCVVGGKDSVAVAFDKNTGREIWKNLSAPEPGYCPPTMITHAGKKQLLIWHPEAINSLNPTTGEVYWSIPIQAGFRMSINAPRKEGRFLFVSAIGNISAMMELSDDKPDAQVLWRGAPTDGVFCSNSTPVLDNGMIYGCDVESGALIGARIEDGKRLWKTNKPTSEERKPRHATAFLVKHADRFFLFNEAGDLILAELSPDGYNELGRFHVLEPTNEAFGRPVVWSHPAFANKCLFARNDEELVCVDLARR